MFCCRSRNSCPSPDERGRPRGWADHSNQRHRETRASTVSSFPLVSRFRTVLVTRPQNSRPVSAKASGRWSHKNVDGGNGCSSMCTAAVLAAAASERGCKSKRLTGRVDRQREKERDREASSGVGRVQWSARGGAGEWKGNAC